LWELIAQDAGQEDSMGRHRHTPEQIVRKLREGERLLNEGKDLTDARIAWDNGLGFVITIASVSATSVTSG
jgi:hypothetical protein